MTLSIFLARFFGLYLLIIGFVYLLRRQFIKKSAEQLFASEGLVLLTAVISLIMGLLIVIGHNIWEFNWRVIITLLGYLTLLKGLVRLFIPHRVDRKFVSKLVKGDNPIYVGLVLLILGLLLTYEGFIGT